MTRKTFAHVGTGEDTPVCFGEPGSRKSGPKFFRRVRVCAEADPDGNFPMSRDVFLESALTPQGVWLMDMCNLSLEVRRVVDLIRWAESLNLRVEYDPPGNMAGYFRGQAYARQPTLFDIG